jgi:hypothetical protein
MNEQAESVPTSPDVWTENDRDLRPPTPERPLVMLRWAVATASGKNLRLYGHNRLQLLPILREAGERAVHSIEAGCWHRYDGLVLPPWDGTEYDGWPGGPSGRPQSTQAKGSS